MTCVFVTTSIVLALSFAPADEDTFPIPLDSTTFPLYVTDDGLALVEFRRGGAPDPAFAHAARLLREIVPLGAVDVERHPQLASVHGIVDFPSTHVFRRGVASAYDGSRQVKELVYYCLEALDAFASGEEAVPARGYHSAREQAQLHVHEEAAHPEPHPPLPPTQVLHATSELLHLRKLEDVLLLGLFPDPDPDDASLSAFAAAALAATVAEARAAYGEAAAAMRHEHLFLEAHAPWLVRSLREKLLLERAAPLLLLLRTGEPTMLYAGKWDADDIGAWVHGHAYVPLLRISHADVQRRYVDEPVPSLLLLLPPTSLERHAAEGVPPPYAEATDGVSRLAHEYHADISFFVAEAAPRMAPLASALALDPFPPEQPRVALWEPTLQRRYVFPRALDGGAAAWLPELRAFVEAFLDGQLAPTLRSAAAPDDPLEEEDEAEGGDASTGAHGGGGGGATAVRTVVAATFERDVLRAKRDVLLGYHAPWCAHCDGLDELLGELAKGAPPPSLQGGDGETAAAAASAASAANAANANASGTGAAPAAAAAPLVAQMDVHANDMHDDFQVTAVPSLLLFPAEAPHAPLVYRGRLEVDAVWAWVGAVHARRRAESSGGSGGGDGGAARPGDAHAAGSGRSAGITAALARAQQSAKLSLEL